MFVRWNGQTVEADEAGRIPGLGDTAVIRRFDAPEALDTRFHEIRSRSALNHVPAGSRVPFEWTVNPYRGCSHACVYCFARPTHEYLDLDAGRDFEKEIIVKVNAPEVLRRELARPSWRREHVAMGTNTDPYQWVEGRYKLMRGIWTALRDAATPASVLTKSPLLLRDIDLMREAGEAAEVTACLSVPTLDEQAWRATEPHTPHPRARLEAVAKLNAAGIPTGILIAPLLPGINDAPEQVERIIALATEAGATSIGGQVLFLHGAVRDIYFDWLRAYRPDLVPRYEQLYAGRGRLPPREARAIERAAGLHNAPRPSGKERPRHRGSAEAARQRPGSVRPARQESLF